MSPELRLHALRHVTIKPVQQHRLRRGRGVQRNHLVRLRPRTPQEEVPAHRLQRPPLQLDPQARPPLVRREGAEIAARRAPLKGHPGVRPGPVVIGAPRGVEAVPPDPRRLGVEQEPHRVQVVDAPLPEVGVPHLPGVVDPGPPAVLRHQPERRPPVDPLPHQPMDRHGLRRVAGILADRHPDAPRVRLLHDLPRVRQAERKRLLHQHVLARPHRLQALRRVEMRRRDHHDRVRLHLPQRHLERSETGRLGQPGDLQRPVQVRLVDIHQGDALEVLPLRHPPHRPLPPPPHAHVDQPDFFHNGLLFRNRPLPRPLS